MTSLKQLTQKESCQRDNGHATTYVHTRTGAPADKDDAVLGDQLPGLLAEAAGVRTVRGLAVTLRKLRE